MRRIVPRAVAALAALVCVPAAGAWTWPSGGAVLQPFVFDPLHPYAAGQHRGIDVGGDAGGPVVAPAGGTVSFAGSMPRSGKSVTIQTPDGLSVTLVHLGSIGVARNSAVAEGAVVGTLGPSGTPEAAEPYVHMGVRVTAQDQGYLDPLAFLPRRSGLPEGPDAVEPAPSVPVAAVPLSSAPEAPAVPVGAGPFPPSAEGAAVPPPDVTAPTFQQPVDDQPAVEPAPKDTTVVAGETAASSESVSRVLESSAA